MPLNGFTVGRDYAINVQGPSGQVQFDLITKFSKKPDMIDKKIKGLDGRTRHVTFYDGWTGSFQLERQDSTAEDFFAAQEAAYYAGQNALPATITETIQEASGAVTQYQYVGVIMKLSDAGTAAGDDTVQLSIDWMAERRIRL